MTVEGTVVAGPRNGIDRGKLLSLSFSSISPLSLVYAVGSLILQQPSVVLY